jgi:hypothetical protein
MLERLAELFEEEQSSGHRVKSRRAANSLPHRGRGWLTRSGGRVRARAT